MQLPEAGKYASHTRTRQNPRASRQSNIEQGKRVVYHTMQEEMKAFDSLPKLLRYAVMYSADKVSAKSLYDNYWKLRRQGYDKSQLINHIFEHLTETLSRKEKAQIIAKTL